MSSPLDPLFTPTQQRLLGAFLLRPEREWYLADLSGHLRVRPSSLQRYLSALVEAGILRRRRDGNRIYYRPDPDCPILPELTSILTKTAGLAEPIRQALQPLAGRIRVAFIHGSIAEGRAVSGSDVDLVVIGDASGAELAMLLRPLTDLLGRPVNFSRYTPSEFASKARDGHHFVSAVQGRKKLFLIGDERGLGELAGRQTPDARTGNEGRA